MRNPLPSILVGLALSASPVFASDATLVLHADQPGPVINRNIYGQFSEHLGHCIYGGIWVGPDSPIPNTNGYRNDVIAALKELHVPILRWPGGCFADEYHWKDGIGPREKRPKMINTHWGGVVEDNSFGTHEFLNFCEMLGIEPYVCINVGSGTVQEAMEWVEYMTSNADSPMANLRRANGRDKPWKVHFIAVGNESWGCGGNMRPEYYSDLYRRFNTFIKDYPQRMVGGKVEKNVIKRIAVSGYIDNLAWTDVLMDRVPVKQMDGISLHYYTLPTGDWDNKGPSTQFDESQWFSTLRNTLKMDDMIAANEAIMDKADPDKHVGIAVDEWGTWYDVEPGTNPGFLFQQNTLRDAIVAGLNLHIFQAHADRVMMANIAQLANVLQSMVLTDGNKMCVTPTYWVFDMFKVHQGATSLRVDLLSPDYTYGREHIPAVSASASRDSAGKVHLSLVNTNPNDAVTVACTIDGLKPASVNGQILTAPTMNAHNTFDTPDNVRPGPFDGAKLDGDRLTVTMPSKSVVMLEL